MSVYIKGMEMPTNCYACPLRKRNGMKIVCPICDESFSVADKNILFFRLKNCPLVPVPEHGDLIDRNETAKTLAHDYAYAAADMVLNEMPTIIPADKEGRNDG